MNYKQSRVHRYYSDLLTKGTEVPVSSEFSCLLKSKKKSQMQKDSARGIVQYFHEGIQVANLKKAR